MTDPDALLLDIQRASECKAATAAQNTPARRTNKDNSCWRGGLAELSPYLACAVRTASVSNSLKSARAT